MERKHRGRQGRQKCARFGFLFEHPTSHSRPPFALVGSLGRAGTCLFPFQPRLLARCRAEAPSVGGMQIVRLRAKAPPH